MNTWYVLAKEDKRYKYDFCPVLHRSHVFKELSKAIAEKIKRERLYKKKLVILKRTCQVLENV